MWKWVVTPNVQELYQWMLQSRVHIVVVRGIHARIGLGRKDVESMVEYDQRQSIVSKCDPQRERERERLKTCLKHLKEYETHFNHNYGIPKSLTQLSNPFSLVQVAVVMFTFHMHIHNFTITLALKILQITNGMNVLLVKSVKESILCIV